MINDMVAKAFARLREMFPNVATERLGQAITSTLIANQ